MLNKLAYGITLPVLCIFEQIRAAVFYTGITRTSYSI